MDSECCICYTDKVITLSCKHFICRNCISKLYKTDCPACSATMLDILSAKDVLEIKNRAAIRKIEIDDDNLNTAITQINQEEDTNSEYSDESQYEDIPNNFEPLNYQEPLGIADEYFNSEIPLDIFEEIALEESLGL